MSQRLELTSNTNKAPSVILHAARPSWALRLSAAAGVSDLLYTVCASHRGGSAGRFAREVAVLRSWLFVGSQLTSLDPAASGAVSEVNPCDQLMRAFVNKQSLADTAAERTPTAR